METKFIRILEIIWLAIGLTGAIMAAYSIIKGQKEPAIYFLAMAVIAGIMYSLRRYQRKNRENS